MAKPDSVGISLPKPYCSACGHDLTGAVTASACPECGRPLVEVLTRGGASVRAVRTAIGVAISLAVTALLVVILLTTGAIP